ncbi:lipoate--protein ligase family protein [Candidatus Avelusimicrobium sp.]
MGKQLLTPALNVYEQMALDDTLAHHALADGPVLRFYHWVAGDSVTFGYGQFVQSVKKQCPASSGPICRRPTGGGIVFHGEDLTFSLIFKNISARPKEIYALLHGAIENALLENGSMDILRQGQVEAQAYAPTQNGLASGCFVNPVENDLLSGGRKILGGAIRRFGEAVLYQGSLQCPHARSNVLFRRAVAQGAARFLQEPFAVFPAQESFLAQARKLAKTQYETLAWNEKF